MEKLQIGWEKGAGRMLEPSTDAYSDPSIPGETQVGWVLLKRLCRDEPLRESNRAVQGILAPYLSCCRRTAGGLPRGRAGSIALRADVMGRGSNTHLG